MGYRPLTVAMRDAWLLVGAAVQADRLVEASALADRAVELSGWDRYRPVGSRAGVDLWRCDLMPRGWAYFARVGRYERMLLIHPDATAFLTETVGFHTLRDAAQREPGLTRLDRLLAAVLIGALVAPDTLDD